MKTLSILMLTLATPALAHPAGITGHTPHLAYLGFVIALGVGIAIRNAIKG